MFDFLKKKKVPAEERKQKQSAQINDKKIKNLREQKFKKIIPLLKNKHYQINDLGMYDFLDSKILNKHGVYETENISSHGYDRYARKIIEEFESGMVLDCGAGLRNEYLSNVINYEIVPYSTTDILGVAEELPFKDESIDAVLSLNVLEHVKDPFLSAKEISRVLKKDGKLYVVVPHLQPVHGYPNHYYNMTSEGLKNLFDKDLKINDQKVIASGLPIFTLNWIISSWANGLEGRDRQNFLSLKLEEFLKPPVELIEKDFVKKLNENKNFELASTTALWATK